MACYRLTCLCIQYLLALVSYILLTDVHLLDLASEGISSTNVNSVVTMETVNGVLFLAPGCVTCPTLPLIGLL